MAGTQGLFKNYFIFYLTLPAKFGMVESVEFATVRMSEPISKEWVESTHRSKEVTFPWGFQDYPSQMAVAGSRGKACLSRGLGTQDLTNIS